MKRQQPTDAAAYAEGRAAAEQRKHFNTDCPYLFSRAGVTQEVFEAEYRAKLNGWFEGWSDWLKENGLDNNFRPFGQPKGAWTAAHRAAEKGAKR